MYNPGDKVVFVKHYDDFVGDEVRIGLKPEMVLTVTDNSELHELVKVYTPNAKSENDWVLLYTDQVVPYHTYTFKKKMNKILEE